LIPAAVRPDDVGMTTVWWARHGENVANLTRTLSYRVFDGDLTQAGRRQAAELAVRLAGSGGEPVSSIVCSPLRRARQTADIIAGRLGQPVAAELEDLRELDVGELDGRNDDLAWEIYDGVLAAWRAGQPDARFPGGENRAELCARLARALTAVSVPATGPRPLIVAHGGALRAALPALTGQPDPGSDLATGSFATLAVGSSDGSPRVQLLSWPGSGPAHAAGEESG
jgi:broad specificity phosphatase PhoE